jgi:hypothetical protein
MHPTVQELLDLRDGESSPETATHVAGCSGCAEEVERLKAVAAELRGLPAMRPPADGWPALRSALASERRRRSMAFGGAGLALAASILLVFVMLPGEKPATQPAVVSSPEIANLMEESRRLEEILRAMGTEGRVVDLWQAGAEVGLQDQIGFIDSRLTEPGLRRVSNDDEVRRLWKSRVDLMNDLVRVRGGRPAYVGL